MFLLPYKYAYIFGCLILFVFWLLIFISRKDLRREMLWASFWGLPLGFTDYFLVPQYWHPDSLFGLVKKYGFGLESFIFFFMVSGIAAVAYEFLCRRKTVKMAGKKQRLPLPFLVSLAVFSLLLYIFPDSAIYDLMVAGAAGGLAMAYFRPDLWQQVVAGSFIFSLLYFFVLFLDIQLFTGVVQDFYNLKNLWGILVLGVPLEEIVAAFFAGSLWSTSYEFIKSYKERKL